MNMISVSLSTYLITIVFAMLIAAVIKGLAVAIEKLGLDRGEEDSDLTVPSANAAKEEEALAVAIAVVHAKNQKL
jgi:Na+-transporting methylmalonyl-CoA/oxaloacetate decarboxylase gamma subunit